MSEYTSKDGRVRLTSDQEINVSMLGPDELVESTIAFSDQIAPDTFSDHGFELTQVIHAIAPDEAMNKRPDLMPATSFQLSVQKGEGDLTVLLVESEGVFQWITPTANIGTAAAEIEKSDWFSFDYIGILSTQPQFIGGLWSAARRRIFKGAVVYVLKFAVGLGLEKIAAGIDGQGPFGLFTLSGKDPAEWTADKPLLPFSGPKKRVLLLIHGTFSTTQGSFGDVTNVAVAPLFLQHWTNSYDHVISFEHKTLGESVEKNACDLSDALTNAVGENEGVVIDAIGYSRGGLVLRHLTEKHWPPQLKIGRIVFVGAPLSGTNLASPRNWNRLLDLYTTFAARAAKLAALAAGQPQTGAVMGAVLQSLSGFAKLVVAQGVDPKWVPGLASMVPSGPLVNNFYKEAAHAAQYHAIASNFEPASTDGLGQKVKLVMADLFMDDLFQVDNDLVVGTTSMTRLPIDGSEPFEISGPEALMLHGPEVSIYHTIYFGDPASLSAISDFLEIVD